MSAPALWDWAAAAYARPGVKDALLTLQDESGVDVALTLWRVWLWETGRVVEPAAEADAIALSARWREAVAPLRAARNALRAPPDGVEPAGARALRGAILDAELAAERLQLEALERLSADAAAPGAPRPGALRDWLGAFAPLQHAGAVEVSSLAAALERA